MYKFSFNNLPKNNSEKPRSLLSQSQYNKSIMKCGYCNIDGHNISECPIDRGLDKILNSCDDPDFSSFNLKILRRIASLCGVKTNLAKLEYILMFKNIWLKNKRGREILEERRIKLEEEIKVLSRIENNNECPICMEVIGDKNKAITECGHTFCLKCLLKSAGKKNNCPLCREKLIEDKIDDEDSLPDSLPDLIQMGESDIEDNEFNENILNYLSNVEMEFRYNEESQFERYVNNIHVPRRQD
jgi:hypothetical protein